MRCMHLYPRRMYWSLKDKVIVITGAGKGLGRAYALYLASLGASIVVNNRRHPGEVLSSADQTVADIKANGGNAIAEYSSVEQPGVGEHLLNVALDTYGQLDAVIANAGVSEACSFHKQELQDFRAIIEINLMGTVNVLHPAFRHMYAQRSGCMIVSTSVAGLYGEHGLPAYSTSKAALLGLVHSLSQEGAAHGLRINALAPFAATPMTEKDLPAALKQQLKPERISPLLAWLISDSCKLNGEIIISGTGRVSRARMMESAALCLPDSFENDDDLLTGIWAQLVDLPLSRTSKGALEQFKQFLSD